MTRHAHILQQGLLLQRGLLIKQACNVIVLALLFLPRVPALVPHASYYTEFEVAAPANSTLLHELFLFFEELCAVVLMLQCGGALNITVAD